MGEKIRGFGAFFVIVLLLLFNVNFIGADDESGDLAQEDVVADSVYVDLEEDYEYIDIDEVGCSEDVEKVEDYEYIDIEEVVSFDEETVSGVGNVSDSVEKLNLNESEGVAQENESLADIENKSLNLNETSNETLTEVENKTGYNYFDIDELAEEIEIEDEGLKSEEKVLKELVKDGKIELEFEVLPGDNVEISKKEFVRNEVEKRVIIFSDVHFEDEVRVYSNLPSSARKQDIVLTWDNEDEVVNDLEYFDLDNDGLTDRISWVVPHLSEQRYSIMIVVGGNNDSSSEILLSVDSPISGTPVLNPVIFNVNINYYNLSNVECRLEINNEIIPLFGIDGTNDSEISLTSGSKEWNLFCYDFFDDSINSSDSGDFEVFDFLIDGIDDFYFNGSGISGELNYQGDSSLTTLIFEGGLVDFDSNGDFNIDASETSTPGEYSLTAITSYYEGDVSDTQNFSIGYVQIDLENNSIDLGDSVEVALIIDSRGFSGNYLIYADESLIGEGSFGAGGVNENIDFDPTNEGDYDLFVNVTIDDKTQSFNGGVLNVDSGIDSTRPDVDLIFPDWEDVIDVEDIDFEYRVNEENGIANCSFELYTSKEDSSGAYVTDDLIFPISSADKNLAFNDDIVDGENVEIKLVEFDKNENYLWEVRCVDTAGNEDSDWNYFSVELNNDSWGNKKTSEANYDRKDEIEDLIVKINSFLEKLDDFGPEERRVLEILELDKDMTFWKKRVVQMEQDLKFNLKFMEESKRVKRIADIYDEIDEIGDNIILDVRSIDSYEFSKNSVDLDLEEVIADYFEAEGTSVTRGSIRSLTDHNEDLQKFLNVDVEAWKLELEYLDGNKEIVLVNKNLAIDLDDDAIVLEIMSEKREVIFVSEVEDVGNSIYSVDVNNLESGNLVYYFEEGFALKEVEKMESILFSDNVVNGGFGITGMFVGVSDSLSFGSFFWIPLFLFLGYFGFFMSGRVRIELWKKEPGVEELVRLINDTSHLVREGKVDGARTNYNRMGEIYKVLPVKCRDFFYGEIKRVRLSIDKKDVLGLIREYEAAKDAFRKDDAMVLHGKINAIYRKLPKKFQEKVYRRLIKKEV